MRWRWVPCYPYAGCFGSNNDDKGIKTTPTPPQGTKANLSRDAYVPTVDPYKETASKIVYLEQNWSPEESLDFYYTAQGSQLIPYAFVIALEQPGT